MAVRRKVVVYPYDVEFAAVLRHSDLLADYEISALVSPPGWGLGGCDAGAADEGEDIGIPVGVDFEECIDGCDAVVFSHSHNTVNFKKIIYPKMLSAIERKKNIICLIELDGMMREEIEELCRKSRISFEYLPGNAGSGFKYDGCPQVLLELTTPVILVSGLGEGTNKFEIQLGLRERFLKMGYKVSQVGTRDCSTLMGFHSFPDFMLEPSIPGEDKIIMLNRFLKNIEKAEQPDVIILGIPGGVVPFSRKVTCGFGLLCYQVSQAVAADAVVFSIYYEDMAPEYFNTLSCLLEYRFGFKVDCFNIANTKLDLNGSEDGGSVLYRRFSSNHIDEKKHIWQSIGKPVLNALNSKDMEEMAELIIDRLSGGSDTEAI